MKNIDKILIPSGPSERIDIQRVDGAVNNFGIEQNYVILGAGPDLYGALKYQELNEKIPSNFDHHLAMYNRLVERVPKEKIELITKSTTAVQNFLEFFKDKREGNYIIVSDKWQINKYNHIFKSLQKKGKISMNANLDSFSINTDEYYNWIQKIASRAKTELELLKI